MRGNDRQPIGGKALELQPVEFGRLFPNTGFRRQRKCLDARWFVPPLILFGVGWGAILGPSTLVALAALPPEKAAVAMGTSWTVHNIGGASGIAFAIFLTRHFDDFRSGYRTLMLALAAIVLIVGMLYQVLSSSRSPVDSGVGQE
ncbi:hypothetical protein ACVBGC_23345 [Burkholderia stagnalis]